MLNISVHSSSPIRWVSIRQLVSISASLWPAKGCQSAVRGWQSWECLFFLVFFLNNTYLGFLSSINVWHENLKLEYTFSNYHLWAENSICMYVHIYIVYPCAKYMLRLKALESIKFQLHYFPAMRPRECCLTSLSFSFLILEIIIMNELASQSFPEHENWQCLSDS